MAAALLASACAPIEHRAGNLPDQDQLSQIQPGVSAKEDVVKILGTPSTVGTFDSDAWYYVSRYTETTAFLSPDLVDQQVTIVTFDKDGKVEKIKRLGMEDGQEIQMVARTTPTVGNELGAVEQILGNLGRFGTGGGL